MADLERTYTIPLRKEYMKVAYYKRAKKAAKALKEFLAKHMKVEDRDIKKVKLSDEVNRAIWARGIRTPPQKITVKAVKNKDGIVKVDFVGLPKKFKAEEKTIKKLIETRSKKAAEKVKVKKTKEETKQVAAEKEPKEKKEETVKKPEKKVKKV